MTEPPVSDVFQASRGINLAHAEQALINALREGAGLDIR